MRIPYPAVLFDLDGTLTDPFEGIVRSAHHAFAALGLPAPSDAELRAWVGPPLRDSFLAHLGDPALADAGLARYRERYLALGAYENRPYPGIAALLAELRAAGVRLFVATSKIRQPTMGILEHFGLLGFFEAVAAPEPHHSAHKAEVIAELRPIVGADWARAVMVGDTTYDVEGARANGLPCIAVSYGYGERAALEAARPLAIVDSVAALREPLIAPR
jgi:phosphoglycolate phosphatase